MTDSAVKESESRSGSSLLDWPVRRAGKPVTTATNQAILTACVEAALAELPDHVEVFRTQLKVCQNWRQEYPRIFQTVTEIMAAASPGTVVQMCRAGLEKALSTFVLRSSTSSDHPNGADSSLSLQQLLMMGPTEQQQQQHELLKTLTYRGNSEQTKQQQQPTVLYPLASPHGTDDDPLWVTGTGAVAQLEAWKAYGCLEPSAAAHARAVCLAPDASVYARDRTFCLLGVTSEMGPAKSLLKLPGARVLGVARGGRKLEELAAWCRAHGAPAATLQVPEGGANLLEQPLAIAEWILAAAPPHQPLVLLPLVYVDGEANVRATVAMDFIVSYVLSRRKSGDVSLAYLTSPSTVYTIPKEAALDAKARYEQDQQQAGSWFSMNKLLQMASFGYWLAPANTWAQTDDDDDDDENDNKPVIFNGVFQLQGPNYCLAKTMQQWRCIVAHADGIRVAAPHAPGTRTWSVVHSPEAATALEGIQYFPPLLTFDVQPSSSLLAAIVLHQLHPATDPPQCRHPLELFWDGAVHGGGWRCPYSYDSILVVTYLLGKTVAPKGWCPEGALAPKPTTRSDANV